MPPSSFPNWAAEVPIKRTYAELPPIYDDVDILMMMMMLVNMNIISPTDDSQAKAKVDGLESKGGKAAAVRLQTELNHLAY